MILPSFHIPRSITTPVETVGRFKALTKRGERKGRWYCTTEGCNKNLTSYLNSLPNDGQEHSFVCSGCGKRKYVNAAILATILIQKTQRENLALGDIK